MLTPLLESEVKAAKNALLIKVNVDEAPNTAMKYGV
jgi:thioredoxin-like negative regulator of GroEL